MPGGIPPTVTKTAGKAGRFGRLASKLKPLGLGLGGNVASIALALIIDQLIGGMMNREKPSDAMDREFELTKEKMKAESRMAKTEREAATQLRKQEGAQEYAGQMGAIQRGDLENRNAVAQRMDPDTLMNSTVPLSDIFHLVF